MAIIPTLEIHNGGLIRRRNLNKQGQPGRGSVKEPQPHARFKDPQARNKFDMIKGIQAQRAASDPKISEAILRANEAPRAAEVVDAAKNPMAEASLIETRKLIAEALAISRADLDKEEIVEDASEIKLIGVNGAIETANLVR
ncbi:hypothetical protein CTI12_AA141120 [Artemisia annua]|uniref:Uncharacterized protein n=1 Tax=Artemisia annua TaxID=35608 RepID=A0A2U1PKW6_ARTAN|nr:hypothetical protein CTI12_AA141120 [Artemisia annua]